MFELNMPRETFVLDAWLMGELRPEQGWLRGLCDASDSTGANEKVYQFIPSTTGVYQFSLIPGSRAVDPILYVAHCNGDGLLYDSGYANGKKYKPACANEHGAGRTETVTVVLYAGATYNVIVDSVQLNAEVVNYFLKGTLLRELKDTAGGFYQMDEADSPATFAPQMEQTSPIPPGSIIGGILGSIILVLAVAILIAKFRQRRN